MTSHCSSNPTSEKEGSVYPSYCFARDDGEIGVSLRSRSGARRRSLMAGGAPSSLQRSSIDAPSGGETTATFMMRIPSGLNIGKVSVVVLLLATAVDFCVSQVHRIDSHEFYDALSTEVIRPAFHYKPATLHPRQKGTSLGSAAISSVTDALSPILPFAGGLDLRREDYWTKSGNWIENIQSVAAQVRDAFSRDGDSEEAMSKKSPLYVPRGGGNVPGKLKTKKATPRKHLSAISAQNPFVSVEEIAEMTLSDVSDAFRYAVECNKEGFNEARFLNGVVPRVRKVVSQMKQVVAKSRGPDAVLSVARPGAAGQTDVLAFSAAMRVFAEWRVLRQVPEGYKGFAVGMSLGHKDVVQNLAKIEQGAHSFMDHQRDAISLQTEGGGSEVRSPTVRELLTFEIETGINPPSKLPRLAEKSAAMGLLWVRRQLHYQTLLFDNVLKIPNRFSSTVDAVSAAYKEVYDRYHGWAVQKIFNYSFQAAPDAEEIYKHMNPRRLEEVMNASKKLRPTNGVNANEKSSILADSDKEKNDNPVIAFFQHVGGEWDKIASSVGKVLLAKHNSGARVSVRGGSMDTGAPGLQQSEVDSFVTEEMVKDAHEHIKNYLDVAFPMLDDLSALFDEMNMDDPTRV